MMHFKIKELEKIKNKRKKILKKKVGEVYNDFETTISLIRNDYELKSFAFKNDISRMNELEYEQRLQDANEVLGELK